MVVGVKLKRLLRVVLEALLLLRLLRVVRAVVDGVLLATSLIVLLKNFWVALSRVDRADHRNPSGVVAAECSSLNGVVLLEACQCRVRGLGYLPA